MRPDQLAKSLRQIAAKIDNSKNPKRELVARDLKRIIAKLPGGEYLNIQDPEVHRQMHGDPDFKHYYVPELFAAGFTKEDLIEAIENIENEFEWSGEFYRGN